MGLLGFTIVRIDAASMGSLLPHRSVALFRRKRKVSKGDIVLVDHPECGLMVKRVAAVTRNGRYSLRGASSSVTSGKRLGSVEGRQIVGVLLSRLS